mmetsp:Transcript_49/g.120  ORF Transcript_49/g.120 Transcript_49/m.120 type:complete len:324 (-) Transcript_49:197-1168(-)
MSVVRHGSDSGSIGKGRCDSISTSETQPLPKKTWADLSEGWDDSDDDAWVSSHISLFSRPEQEADPAEHAVQKLVRPACGDSYDTIRWPRVHAESPSDDERIWLAASSQNGSSQGSRAGSPLPFSEGSELHSIGACRPCIFFPKQVGCHNGSECDYCHLDHASRIHHRRHRRRHRRGERRGALESCPESDASLAGTPQAALPFPESSTASSSFLQDVETRTLMTGSARPLALATQSQPASENGKDQRVDDELRASLSRESPWPTWRNVQAQSPSEDERGWNPETHVPKAANSRTQQRARRRAARHAMCSDPRASTPEFSLDVR